MMLYDKPVWKLMHEMVKDLALKKGQVFSRDEVLAWFAEHYPKVKENTVSAHLIRQSTNAPSRVHYHAKPGDDDLFFKLERGKLRLYDPDIDPPPIYKGPGRRSVSPAAKGKPSLSRDVLDVIEQHQRDWEQALRNAELRVKALEEENDGLRTELDTRKSVLDEVTDEVLRKRLSQLGSPPLDTLIREAGVVLEDRLRRAGGVDKVLHGVALVDAVLNKHKGRLIFSAHPGEQEGVMMLYRGAMQFVRNPPMHRLVQYSESAARLLLRLVDALLGLLSELEPRLRGEVGVDDIRRMLTRMRIPVGQLAFYKALYAAGDEGLSMSDLVSTLDLTRDQVSGVLGALGQRINQTEALQGKGGIMVVLHASQEGGERHYRIRATLREALEAEAIV